MGEKLKEALETLMREPVESRAAATPTIALEANVIAALENVLTYLNGQHAKTVSNGVINAHARRTIAALIAVGSDSLAAAQSTGRRALEGEKP